MYEDSLKEDLSDVLENHPEASAVSTVTKEEAVTINKASDDELVIASIDGKYLRFARLEHVPAGCRTYARKEELRPQTKKQIESMYSVVKTPKSFKDHDSAVEELWAAFAELPVTEPKLPVVEKLPKEARDKKYLKKREPDVYEIKPVSERSTKALALMAPQAKACVEIIRADGRSRYQEQELRDLMESNKEKIRSKQKPWRVFQYYRPTYIQAGILVQK